MQICEHSDATHCESVPYHTNGNALYSAYLVTNPQSSILTILNSQSSNPQILNPKILRSNYNSKFQLPSIVSGAIAAAKMRRAQRRYVPYDELVEPHFHRCHSRSSSGCKLPGS